MGADNYGLYAIALAAPSLIGTFRDWGINTAAVKYTAQYNSENNSQKIKSVFISTLLFELALGGLLSILSFALSGFLATTFNRPILTPVIQIASFVILTGALINVATSAFTGMEKMHLNSIMLIVQSTVKTALIIALVIWLNPLGLGTTGAITGYTVAVLFAGLIGILLAYTMYKSLPKTTNSKLEILSTIKTMLKYGLPVSVGAILSGFLLQFYTWVMAIYVTNNAAIGNYTVALNFVVLITFFATPVTTMLFPAFSKLDALKDRETLKNVFQFSVKYASIIVVPVAFMVMALAQPAIATIFQNKYVEAPLFLALLSITYLYTAFGNLSTGNLINGQGYTTFNLILAILTAAIGFPLGFFLISSYGIIGLIITSLAAGLPSLFVSLYFIKKHFEVSVDWVSSTKIIFSSGIAALLTYLLVSQLALSSLIQFVVGVLAHYVPIPQLVLSNLIQLGIGVIAFVIIFVFVAVLTRTINRFDISSIREIINSLGPLRKPLGALLSLIELLMKILRV